MSIIQDQQLIESLSDQDLARLIQGEIPQLAHLAPVGVSETTRRLDFRREYEEELARLDQPQENIATQLAQQLLLQQGVPTVNQGVTDEFPQGGIAGPQQATEETAATGTATPTATTAPATATPATAPVPAAGGQVPGMQLGGSLRDRLVERDLDDVDIEALEQEALQAGLGPAEIAALLAAFGKPIYKHGIKPAFNWAKSGLASLFGRGAEAVGRRGPALRYSGQEALEETVEEIPKYIDEAFPDLSQRLQRPRPVTRPRKLSDREIGEQYAKMLGKEGAWGIGQGAATLGTLKGLDWLLSDTPTSTEMPSDWFERSEEMMPDTTLGRQSTAPLDIRDYLGGYQEAPGPWSNIFHTPTGLDPTGSLDEWMERSDFTQEDLDRAKAALIPAGAGERRESDEFDPRDTAALGMALQSPEEQLQSIIDLMQTAQVGGPGLGPEGDPVSGKIMAYIEELREREGITPAYDELLNLQVEQALEAERQRERGIGQLSTILGRYGTPGAAETAIQEHLGLSSLVGPGQERAMSLADLASAIGGNVMPGDLGEGLAEATRNAVARQQETSRQNLALQLQGGGLEEARKARQDDLRMEINRLTTASESERAEILRRIQQIRMELAQGPEELMGSYFDALAGEETSRRDDERMMAQARAQMMPQLFNIAAQIIGPGGQVTANDMDTNEQIDALQAAISHVQDATGAPGADVQMAWIVVRAMSKALIDKGIFTQAQVDQALAAGEGSAALDAFADEIGITPGMFEDNQLP